MKKDGSSHVYILSMLRIIIVNTLRPTLPLMNRGTARHRRIGLIRVWRQWPLHLSIYLIFVTLDFTFGHIAVATFAKFRHTLTRGSPADKIWDDFNEPKAGPNEKNPPVSYIETQSPYITTNAKKAMQVGSSLEYAKSFKSIYYGKKVRAKRMQSALIPFAQPTPSPDNACRLRNA